MDGLINDILHAVVVFFTDPARLMPALGAMIVQLVLTHKLKLLVPLDWKNTVRDRVTEFGVVFLGWPVYIFGRYAWEHKAGHAFGAQAPFATFIGLVLTLSTPYLYKLLPTKLRGRLSARQQRRRH